MEKVTYISKWNLEARKGGHKAVVVSDGSDDVWLVRWQPMMAHGGAVGSVDCVAVVHGMV